MFASLFMQFHVLIFHQSGCTVVYNVYMHVTEQQILAHHPRNVEVCHVVLICVWCPAMCVVCVHNVCVCRSCVSE